VEHVEDVRNKDGQTQYLVKWKGYSSLENSWVAETDFNETEVIEEFWAKRTAEVTQPE
jgi:hypothetical protein